MEDSKHSSFRRFGKRVVVSIAGRAKPKLTFGEAEVGEVTCNFDGLTLSLPFAVLPDAGLPAGYTQVEYVDCYGVPSNRLATVEFNNESTYGIYSPRSVHDVTLLVRDGETRFDGFMATDPNQNIYDNAIIVSNAVLTVSKSKAGVDMRMAGQQVRLCGDRQVRT